MPSRASARRSIRALTDRARSVQLSAQESAFACAHRRASRRPKLFNLDLHASVIADLADGLRPLDVGLTRWSLSHGNRHFRRVFKGPDPIDVVNDRTWRELDENMIDRFQERYRAFLASFDGFVVTYPPPFAELFAGLGKPVLVMSATRYETPYTGRPASWHRIDRFLQEETRSGRLLLAANNKADRDYIEYFTGLRPSYVPSLCEYTKARWPGTGGPQVFFCRSSRLSRHIVDVTRGRWTPVDQAVGSRYGWRSLASTSEILVIPYNVSTMTLFELSTAGVPVVVPARNLLLDLMREFDEVLSELSFHQVEGRDTQALPRADPNAVHEPSVVDWWLDRADFYDSVLMPNVRLIDGLHELATKRSTGTDLPYEEYLASIKKRNDRLREGRCDLLTAFCEML